MELREPSSQSNKHIQPSIRSFFQPQTSVPALRQNFTSAAVSTSPAATARKPAAEQPKSSVTLVSEEHIQPLRRINALLLPICYPDSFYSKILSPSPPAPANLSRVILWHDTPSAPKVIGGIVVRLDPSISYISTPQNQLYVEGSYDVYIQSLALLSPYREKGLASQALEEVVRAAVEIGGQGIRVRDLYAHVWTENSDALEWYQKRGFKKEGEVVAGYYRRLRPDGAWILRRKVGVQDHLDRSMGVGEENEAVTEAVTRDGAVMEARTEGQTKGLNWKENDRPGFGPTKSFQDRRPANEWNDLPEDVVRNGTGLKPPSVGSSATSSRSSSRSGLDARKKRRQYPAAAFGIE